MLLPELDRGEIDVVAEILGVHPVHEHRQLPLLVEGIVQVHLTEVVALLESPQVADVLVEPERQVVRGVFVEVDLEDPLLMDRLHLEHRDRREFRHGYLGALLRSAFVFCHVVVGPRAGSQGRTPIVRAVGFRGLRRRPTRGGGQGRHAFPHGLRFGLALLFAERLVLGADVRVLRLGRGAVRREHRGRAIEQAGLAPGPRRSRDLGSLRSSERREHDLRDLRVRGRDHGLQIRVFTHLGQLDRTLTLQIVEGTLDLRGQELRRDGRAERLVIVDLVEVRLDHRPVRRSVPGHVHLEAEADVRGGRLKRLPENLRAELRQLHRYRRFVPIQERSVPQAHDLLGHAPVRVLERGYEPELARLVDDGAHELGPGLHARELPLRRRNLLLGDTESDHGVHDAPSLPLAGFGLVRARTHVLHVAKEGELRLSVRVRRQVRLVVHVVVDEGIVQVGKADQLAGAHRLVEEDLLGVGRRRQSREGHQERERDNSEGDTLPRAHGSPPIDPKSWASPVARV